MRLLLVLHGPRHLRHLRPVLDELIARGHELVVRLDTGDPAATPPLVGAIDVGRVPARPPGWATLARQLRFGLDHLRYLEPEYAAVVGPADRARTRAPRPLVALAGRLDAPWRRRLARALTALDRAVPVPASLVEDLRRVAPDVALISPLVSLGSLQPEHVRAAARLGIPTALLVASWDNLTNKGGLRDVPDRVVVWSHAQAREAIGLHAVPAERVVVTGAHPVDPWVDRRPSRDRAAFCARAGLDPTRPYVLYVCSSAFVAPDEPSFVARWLTSVRAGGTAAPGVLVRPHPANRDPWRGVDPSEPGRVVLWPADDDDDDNNNYADSILHAAAVVGINTSVLVEAAVAGRPVLTVLDDDFAATQVGTRHFAHLSDRRDGVLAVARNLDEHGAQLAAALAEPASGAARRRAFTERFIRPHGLDVPAAPLVADVLEQLGRQPSRSRHPRAGQRLAAVALAPVARATPAALRAIRLLLPPRPLARGAPASRRSPALRVLVVLDHAGLLIHFDTVLAALVERGHVVLVAFGRRKWPEAVAEALGPGPVVLETRPPRRTDVFAGLLRRSRAGLDAAGYLAPGLRGAVSARAKWQRAPDVPAVLRHLPVLPEPLARRLVGVLARVERAVPADVTVERWLARARPDLLIVSPLVQRDAYQDDLVKAARAARVPSALAVASWDNLTSKGRIRTIPDRVLVWNEAQHREAEALHRVSGERLRVTGSPQFERWTSAAETPPDEPPHVLFVGSQQVPVEEEVAFVRAWLEATAGSPLRDLRLVVRPHPTAVAGWGQVDLGDPRATVARRDGALPVGEPERRAYFGALSAASAVLGINSTALLEAAIAGRPVHTVALPALRRFQGDLVHYTHLLPPRGGPLQEAPSFAAHVDRLAADLADPEAVRRRSDAFVAQFVRPPDGGSSVDLTVDELLATAAVGPGRPHGRGPARLAVVPLALAATMSDRLRTRASATRRAWSSRARASRHARG
ncbi:MAG: hypothetical protein WKF94_08940 [Solirubrobacteraceae bacterium]